MVLLSIWVVFAVILLSAACVMKVPGHRGLIAFERLMGIILVMPSVQMLLNDISNYLKQTPPAQSNSSVSRLVIGVLPTGAKNSLFTLSANFRAWGLRTSNPPSLLQ